MAIPWGIITGGLGLGASALGSMFDETTPGSHNAQWLQNPQYGYTEGNMKYLSDYYNRGLQGIQQGKAPQWYQQYEQAKKPRQRQDLYQTYFGGNWGPGIMDQMKSYNVQRGTPAGQQGTLYGKQLSDYATQSEKIDEYFNTMGANAMQQSENTYLQGMRQLPEGPSGQWDIWDTQGSYNPSWLTKVGQGLSSFAPYANEMMGDWNPFAKKSTTDYPEAYMDANRTMASPYASYDQAENMYGPGGFDPSQMPNTQQYMPIGQTPFSTPSYTENPPGYQYPTGRSMGATPGRTPMNYSGYSNNSFMNSMNQDTTPSWMYNTGKGVNQNVSPVWNWLKSDPVGRGTNSMLDYLSTDPVGYAAKYWGNKVQNLWSGLSGGSYTPWRW